MATVGVPVNAATGGGTWRQVGTFWSLKKVETQTVLLQEKNDCVNFDVANVTIGVDIKFEKTLDVEIPFQHYL